MRRHFVFFLLFLLLIPSPTFAKTKSGEATGHLEARVIPSKVHVGDEVRLVIQAQFPKGYSLQPISTKTAFLPFELRSIDKSITAKRGEKYFQTITIRLTVFEMGDLKIPSFPVSVWNILGQRIQVKTPELAVRVVSVGKTKTDKGDIRPIKGPATVSLRYLWDWGLGILAVLLTVVLIFLILRRLRKRLADAESLLPPQERLKKELSRLSTSDLLSLGKIKEHYSELSDILRRYFERRYALDLSELTSPEILFLLKQKNLDSSVLEKLREVFEKTDLVKFAKFIPDRMLAQELEKKINEMVAATQEVPHEV